MGLVGLERQIESGLKVWEERGVSKFKVGERRWVWEEMGVRTWMKKW